MATHNRPACSLSTIIILCALIISQTHHPFNPKRRFDTLPAPCSHFSATTRAAPLPSRPLPSRRRSLFAHLPLRRHLRTSSFLPSKQRPDPRQRTRRVPNRSPLTRLALIARSRMALLSLRRAERRLSSPTRGRVTPRQLGGASWCPRCACFPTQTATAATML